MPNILLQATSDTAMAEEARTLLTIMLSHHGIEHLRSSQRSTAKEMEDALLNARAKPADS